MKISGWFRLLLALCLVLGMTSESLAASNTSDSLLSDRVSGRAIPGLELHTQSDFSQFLAQVDHLSMPEKIRVRVTGDWPCSTAVPYQVIEVDFKTYVKQVLPQEWYSFWPEESLKAGAVAVKMYAWYWIERGGKWLDADLYGNTCDQWFRPGYEKASTNQAVEETWSWVLLREDQMFETRHKVIAACDPPICMNQAESARLAQEGYTWQEILEHFYDGSQLVELGLPVDSSNPDAEIFPGDPDDLPDPVSTETFAHYLPFLTRDLP